MLRSPAYFDAFFGTLPQTLAMYKEHEELLKANEELTGEFLQYRPVVLRRHPIMSSEVVKDVIY